MPKMLFRVDLHNLILVHIDIKLNWQINLIKGKCSRTLIYMVLLYIWSFCSLFILLIVSVELLSENFDIENRLNVYG